LCRFHLTQQKWIVDKIDEAIKITVDHFNRKIKDLDEKIEKIDRETRLG
jgi:hypothetical protein